MVAFAHCNVPQRRQAAAVINISISARLVFQVHFAAEHGDQMNDSNVSWDKETVGGKIS